MPVPCILFPNTGTMVQGTGKVACANGLCYPIGQIAAQGEREPCRMQRIMNMETNINTVTATDAELETAFHQAALDGSTYKWWTLLTNVPQCGGASGRALPAARREFKRLGGRVYLALHSAEREDGLPYRWTSWGIFWPHSPWPEGADLVVVGHSPDHCAHKLGGGDARKGWGIFHG